MPELINEKIDTFLGLNNMLNPASAEYQEGMAYKSANSRIDEHGLWTPQQALTGVGAVDTAASPTGGGVHFKALTVDDVLTIVNMPVGTSCDVGPNKKLYSTTGSGYVKNAGGDITDLTRPTISVEDENTGTSRAEIGTYYYMCTIYNTTYQREGLPSATINSGEIIKDGTNDYIVLTSGTTATTTNRIRFYRSLRTSSSENIYNATNKWYFLGEITSGTTFSDYMHDQEILDGEYEGRGTAPPQDIDYLVSYNNRMLYFKGNVLYWSSAGRPEEVAQKYTVTIGSSTVTCYPKLGIGKYGESKYEIGELSGHKVLGAMPLYGKCYVWTAALMGHLEPNTNFEGYRFRLLYKEIGLTSDKTLALSPFGLFGADRKGVWLFRGTGFPRRLTDYRVDIESSNKETYLTQANRTNSFGCWVSDLNEYFWGVTGRIIAYQANRDIFVGPYNYAVTGGVNFANNNGMKTYLSGGQTPNPNSKDSSSQDLRFWFGQSKPTTIKEKVRIEVVFATAGNIDAEVIQNCYASETGAVGTVTKTMSTAVDEIAPYSSGRLFRLKLTGESGAEIAVISYKYEPVNWTIKYRG